MKRHSAFLITAAFAASQVLGALPVSAAYVRDIVFPVQEPVTFSDDFSDARSGGRQHEGNDLMGKKMYHLLAAVDGTVTQVVDPEASYGRAIVIRDDEGWTYHYIHVNNDTPGTDDGKGTFEDAYAPGMRRGVRVTKGQVIAYMGDSGNAENVGAHLHFEIRMPGGTAINPYESLLAVQLNYRFSPTASRDDAPDINTDKKIPFIDGVKACIGGSRIKTADSKAVYYCGDDGKRYVFPNDKTYYTWYENFSGVVTVTPEELASIPLGGNVTYRPGVKMVKIQSDPRVYAVDRGGTLRWVASSDIAKGLYGVNWAKQVDDVSDAFFINYKMGDPITAL